jgi:hypothetical protein
MATARASEAPPEPNHYEQQLIVERANVACWPRYSRDNLDRMEAGLPVITWGSRVGITHPGMRCCWLHPDGSVTPANRVDWLI